VAWSCPRPWIGTVQSPQTSGQAQFFRAMKKAVAPLDRGPLLDPDIVLTHPPNPRLFATILYSVGKVLQERGLALFRQIYREDQHHLAELKLCEVCSVKEVDTALLDVGKG